MNENTTFDKENRTLIKIVHLLPGLILVGLINLSSQFSASYISIGSVTIAILLGIIINNLLPVNESFNPGINIAEKKFLAFAIMLTGLQLDISVLTSLGFKAVIMIVLVVTSSISAGLICGRLFKLTTPFSLLLGIGNAICGSSAIAGAAPLLNAKDEEIGLSISVVNFLGTLGIFFTPFIAHLIVDNRPLLSGLFIGGSLQAVGQVTAAGFSMSDEIGRIATVVKMGRILMLGPILVLLSLALNVKSSAEKKRSPVPPFIIGFIILALITNIFSIPDTLLDILKKISKNFLILAMAGIGLKITLVKLIKQGPKALIVGSIVFIIQLNICAGFILIFY